MDADHVEEQAAFQAAMRAEKDGRIVGRQRMGVEREGLPTYFIRSKKCEGRNSAGVNEIWRGGSRMPLSVSMDGATGIDGFTPAAENSSEFSAMGPGKSMVMQ